MSLLAIFAGAALVGCDRDDSDNIRSYTVSKTLPVGKLPDSDLPQTADVMLPIQWTLPAGWTALKATGIETAAFSVSAANPKLKATVVPLAGAQSVGDNVRRWEKELGLPPTPDENLSSVVNMVKLSDATADVVDLTGATPADGKPQERTLGAIIPHGEQTWFFKLRGDAALVAPQQAAFNQFVRTIRFSDDTPPAGPTEASTDRPATGAPPASPADAPNAPAVTAHEAGSITYDSPANWTRDAASNAFRVVAFNLQAADGQAAQIVVTRFQGLPGTLIENLNRWRGEVGLAPIAELSAAPPTKVTVGGVEGMQFQFEGVAAPGAPAKANDSVIVSRGETWWFFKLQGPAALVKAQQPAFSQFLSSVRFTGESH